jgi:PAS domain S-box-containing protein
MNIRMQKKPVHTTVKGGGELSSNKLKALIENAYEGIVLYDQTGFIQYASPSLRNFGGYLESDLLGRRGSEFVHPDEQDQAKEAFYKVLLKPGSSITLTQRLATKSGGYLWTEYTLTNLLDNPDVQGIVSNFRNIHDRKLAEQRANETQRLLTVISQNVPDGIFLCQQQGDFQYVNKAFQDITGYENTEAIRQLHMADLLADRSQWTALQKEMKTSGAIRNRQIPLIRQSGERFWGLLSLSNFKDEKGGKFFVGSFRDISRQKFAEDELQRSQMLLNAVSKNISEAIYRSTRKRLIYVNEAFVKMFGYKNLNELLLLNPQALYAEPVRNQYLRTLKQTGRLRNAEVKFKKKNGKTFWGLLSCSLVQGSTDEMLIDGSIRDITEQKQAQEELKRNQEFLSSINKNINEGIFRSDGKRLVYVNHAFVQMFGYDNMAQMLDIPPIKLFVNPPERKKVLNQVMRQGSVTNYEIRYRRKNGTQFWGMVSYTLTREADGKLYFDGAIRDITRQKESEERLRKSQQLLSSINRNISEAIYRSSLGKGFVYVNPAFLELFGFASLEEINQRRPRDLYADQKALNKMRKVIAEQGEVRNVEMLMRKKNGEEFWAHVSATEVEEDGEVFYDGAIKDITRQKKSEKELIESRNFIDNVMRTVAAPIFVKDSKHRWIMFNDAFAWFIGKPRKDLLNKTDRDFFPREEAKVFWKVDEQVLKTGDVILNREKITAKGQTKHLLTVKSRYVNELGEKFIIGFITDITEIKKVEERINSLYANLQGVLESTQDSIYALDKNFCYQAFNNNHAHMAKLLYKADIKIGDHKFSVIKSSPEEKWLKAELRKAMRGEHFVSEQRVDHARYKNRYIQTTYNPIRNRGGEVTGVAVFVKDVTEIRLVEEAIRQNNATFSGVLESTTDQIIAVNKDYQYIMFNRSHERAIRIGTGRTIRKGGSVLEAVPAERKAIAKSEMDRALKGESFMSEYHLNGNVVLEASYNAIRNESGTILGVAIFMRDVTNRIRAEKKLKALNEELVMQNWQLAAQEEELKATLEELSERNFELDQLMYKTSHDLRSPLSSILGLVNLANLDKDHTHYQEYLDKIEGRIKKLDEFIRSMLNYAQVNRSETVYEVIDLEDLALTSVRELEHLENYHDLRVDIVPKGKTQFKSDPLRVKIIFSNIISNAFKYYNAEVSSYLKITLDVNHFNATITFKDNGIGIREEYVGRVFDMFYRATERSQGSGLGMYIVKQAVDKLNGTVQIKSIFTKGTTIKIVLPNH